MPINHSTLRGICILVVEADYVAAMEMVDFLQEAGATVVGPVPTEVEALITLRRGGINLVIFNAILRDRRADMLGEFLRHHNIPSLMVNDWRLSAGDPLCEGRPQMLHPVDQRPFGKAVRKRLAA